MQSSWFRLICFFSSVALVGAIAILLSGGFFTVQEVRCQVEANPCPDFVQAELEKTHGQSIFFTDFTKVAEGITAKAPFLQDFEITTQLPHTLALKFVPAQEKYALELSPQEQAVIDESGVVVRIGQQVQLPVIHVSEDFRSQLQIRSQLNPTLHHQLQEMVAQLQQHSFVYQEISLLSDQKIEVSLQDGRKALLTVDQAPAQIMTLAYILKNVNFQALKQPVSIIDLRFKYPILKSS